MKGEQGGTSVMNEEELKEKAKEQEDTWNGL